MRSVIFLLLLLSLSFKDYAQEFVEAQIKLRSNIVLFLKEEGYMPEIDSDGDIMFKKEGVKYFVSIDKKDTHPFYISLFLLYTYDETYTKEKIINGLPELNRYKAVKILCYDKSYSCQAEMYLVNAEHFKYTFYKLMDQIEAMRSELIEICKSSKSEEVSLTQIPVSASNQLFFPIYGITLGKTSVKDMKKLGYIVKTSKEGKSHYCDVKTLAFWDHDDDNIFEQMYITHSKNIPDAWEEKLGLKWSLSFAQWMDLFKRMEFAVEVEKNPKVEEYSGRKTLSGELAALSQDKTLEFNLNFNYGNENNEGYTINSKNTLYSIRIKYHKPGN